ncbi:hypothetical protein [Bradyrhizobium sp. LTSP885]|uniref:hypothetical protein n=1 Tax=Bradyrhizobium sp. LTSP885 TaxID=1619232 RepID=UPI000ABBCA5B|nr:hypothetical protein [Bradyrhizobium sp. LTSP885]
MTTATEDPLADLGLTDTAPKPATATLRTDAGSGQVEATEADEAGRDEVEVGEIEFGFSDFVPTAKRKTEGSKYKFDQLPAPATWTEGPNKGKPKIANFVVKLQPGVDPDKLRRSVQSATTQANKSGDKYFVSRTVSEDGKLTGMIVYRTDDRPKK